MSGNGSCLAMLGLGEIPAPQRPERYLISTSGDRGFGGGLLRDLAGDCGELRGSADGIFTIAASLWSLTAWSHGSTLAHPPQTRMSVTACSRKRLWNPGEYQPRGVNLPRSSCACAVGVSRGSHRPRSGCSTALERISVVSRDPSGNRDARWYRESQLVCELLYPNERWL